MILLVPNCCIDNLLLVLHQLRAVPASSKVNEYLAHARIYRFDNVRSSSVYDYDLKIIEHYSIQRSRVGGAVVQIRHIDIAKLVCYSFHQRGFPRSWTALDDISSVFRRIYKLSYMGRKSLGSWTS